MALARYFFSDSDINISLFYKGGTACFSSANGSLWTELWPTLFAEDIALYLEYVPSHLDQQRNESMTGGNISPRSDDECRADDLSNLDSCRARTKKKKVVDTSLFAIANNIAADILAGHAAVKG